MKIYCPRCNKDSTNSSCPSSFVRAGVYSRTSDGKAIQRYRCLVCKKHFSSATFEACYRQKKRHKNHAVWVHLNAKQSQRRLAINLSITRTTLVRKFLFLAEWAEMKFVEGNYLQEKAASVEFDDLETSEQTKYKPLSVTLAVETGTRRILGFEVSEMPFKGVLPKRAQIYLPRWDERRAGRHKLFKDIRDFVTDDPIIKSDQNPHYPRDVKRFFPQSRHVRYKGRRSHHGGQGELKVGGFDPLFALNHTCAMLRANINRLIRRTWDNTKKKERLRAHLYLYAHYHNSVLLKA